MLELLGHTRVPVAEPILDRRELGQLPLIVGVSVDNRSVHGLCTSAKPGLHAESLGVSELVEIARVAPLHIPDRLDGRGVAVVKGGKLA